MSDFKKSRARALLPQLVLVALLLSLAASMGARAQTSLSLPSPTGPLLVGTESLWVTDFSRPEVGSSAPYDVRALSVQLWYPASRTDSATTAEYIPNVEAWNAVYSSGFIELLRSVRGNALRMAPLTPLMDRFPVLLFSSGFGMSRHFYSTLLEDLASHGFIVVAIDRPYLNTVQLPQGEVLSPRNGFWDAFPATKGIDSLEAAIEQLRFSEGYLGADQTVVMEHLERLNHQDSQSRFSERMNLDLIFNLAHSAGGIPARALIVDANAPYRGYVFFDSKVHQTTGSRTITLPVQGWVRSPVLFMGLEYATPPPSEFAKQLQAPLTIARLVGTSHNSVTDLAFLTAMAENNTTAAVQAQTHLRIVSSLTRRFIASVLEPSDAFSTQLPSDEERLAQIEVLHPSSHTPNR